VFATLSASLIHGGRELVGRVRIRLTFWLRLRRSVCIYLARCTLLLAGAVYCHVLESDTSNQTFWNAVALQPQASAVLPGLTGLRNFALGGSDRDIPQCNPTQR
jgi:hypothetical protein